MRLANDLDEAAARKCDSVRRNANRERDPARAPMRNGRDRNSDCRGRAMCRDSRWDSDQRGTKQRLERCLGLLLASQSGEQTHDYMMRSQHLPCRSP